ncbi:MAG: heavy metal translocating P-type ATPase [Shewanella sp.]|nr:heavy metal translocating P-type ATPase [Shewanella sp.]MCF1430350.1 heavy metal translocating P-type ATPase [Shewanella sp.]MCF1438093.1 heavy metal translocating P-type ATPase [Shewanella sp.]MCF1459325.1 heavy metal translocating P-type ATPase [Shewanella sp.]
MSEIRCFHCNEPVFCGDQFQTRINGQLQTMCCPGCQAVSQAIIEAGLTNYYKFRTEPGKRQNALVPDELRAFSAYDLEEVQADFVHQEGELSEVSLTLDGISCAACAWLIEHKLQHLPGIARVSVNTTTHRALIHYQKAALKLSDILQAIARIGYQAAPYQLDEQELRFKRDGQRFLIRLGLAGLATMQVMMFAFALYSGYFTDLEQEYREYFRWVSLIFAAPVVFYSAAPFYFSAIRSLLMGKVNMDVAVSIAICGAYLASCIATIKGTGEVYFESVTMFTFFLLLGRYFEQKALQKASISASNLHKLVPLTARLVRDGKITVIPAKQLRLGDVIQVRPGETIAADGDIVAGHSSVNEAMLTGEQLPLEKANGSEVYAGTINIDQPIEVKITALGQDQLVAKIIRLQESASHAKPRIAETASRLSGIFSTVILAIAALTWLVWHFYRPEDAFWVTLSVLVATCPCALALATPTAVTCATAQLTKLGIIVRKSAVFETLPEITQVVFDKTGTLTQGELQLHAWQSGDETDKQSSLNIIAHLEQGSLHPIAKAFAPFLGQSLQLENIHHQVGLGVSSTLDGALYKVGHFDFACQGAPAPQWYQPSDAGQQIWLSRNGVPIGCAVLADKVREDSAQTICALKALGISVSIASGDRSEQVNKLAALLGVTEVNAGMLPGDKLAYVQSLQPEHKVAMFGDGINDAPVLAGADLSVAMGSGTAIAKNSADTILLGDHLSRFVQAVRIARATRRIIYQNLYWALGYNLLILPLAVTGHIYPYIAALGMSASSLVVVSNSLRLLRIRL